LAPKMPRMSTARALRSLKGQAKIMALLSILPRPPQTKAEIAADKAKRYPNEEIFDVETVCEKDPLDNS
jgi:hypothetical protein